MSDAYSTLKITRHLNVIDDIRRGRPAPPVHVQIILSDLCNQACSFCAYRDPSYSSSQRFFVVDAANLKRGDRRDAAHPERNYNPNRMIEAGKLNEILNDCATMGVRGVQFTGGGEPTVHPQFVDACNWATELGLSFAVVSNGVRIAQRGYHTTVSRGAWARISIDAGTAPTYGAIRNVPAGHFDAAWQAVESIAEAARWRQTGCIVGVGFVVTPQNYHEVYEATRLAKERGAHNIRISAQFSAEGDALFDDCREAAAELCAAAVRDFADDSFAVYERFSEKLDDLDQGRPDYQQCDYQKVTTYIGADLNVYRCCVQAYNDHGLVGSIAGRRFADLWLSKERAAEMAAFDAASCERCQFNRINRQLRYVLAPTDPKHAEFV